MKFGHHGFYQKWKQSFLQGDFLYLLQFGGANLNREFHSHLHQSDGKISRVKQFPCFETHGEDYYPLIVFFLII